MKWIECGGDFIEADVIRWTEAVWQKRSRRARPTKVGQRIVTAEVLRPECARGFVSLLVRGCQSAEEGGPGQQAHALRKNEEIARKRQTIERGDPKRLLWSDESARAALLDG